MNKKVPTEIYSRVVGYFRPVNQWNAGKREEYGERQTVKFEEVTNAIRNTDRHN